MLRPTMLNEVGLTLTIVESVKQWLLKKSIYSKYLNDFFSALPRKSLDLDPNKTPVKLCRFHQISEFSPFLFFLLAIQEQHSHMAFSGIWIKVLPVSKRNW